MILRDLCDLYDRCSTDEGMTVSPFGWSIVKVAYRLRIDEAGELRNVIPYVSGDADKKSETIPMQVPEQEGRTSAIKPFFLCDTGEYLLAAGGGKAEDKFNRSAELHKEVLACCDSALAHAVVAFFGRGPQRNRLIEMVEQEKDVQGKSVFSNSRQTMAVAERLSMRMLLFKMPGMHIAKNGCRKKRRRMGDAR